MSRDSSRRISRFFIDEQGGVYFGYVLEFEKKGEGEFSVAFGPLTEPWDSLSRHAIRPVTKPLAPAVLPSYPPAQVVREGQTIAVDVLQNPQTGQKIIDQFQITSSLIPPGGPGVRIREVAPQGGSSMSSANAHGSQPSRLTAQGMMLRDLLTWAYNVSGGRIEGPVSELGRTFDVEIVTKPGENAELKDIFARTVPQKLGLRVERVTPVSDVLVLTRTGDSAKLLPSTEKGSTMRSGLGQYSAKGAPIQNLVMLAEDKLRLPVIDETGLTGRFDFEMQFDAQRPESLYDAVRSLGLELKADRRPIEKLIVTKLSTAAPQQ